MKTERFIAQKMMANDGFNFARPLIRIAILSIILGVAVMLLSVAIVTGFQNEISGKVTGFGAHIHIKPFNSNHSFEQEPVSTQQPFYPNINIDNVEHIQKYAIKPGIVKQGRQLQGVVLKGVGSDFKKDFFQDKMIEGDLPDVYGEKAKNQVAISKLLANMLQVKLGDKLRMYFVINEKQRARAFTVCGIFNTGLSDFDKQFIISDIRHIQKLNHWSENEVGGFELFVKDFQQLEMTAAKIYETIPFDLNVQHIKSMYPEIFDWLKLQDMNVVIILIILILVSSVTMISTLLILILERTSMIGLLKSMGMQDKSIQKIFLYNAAYIILKGLILGNVIALILGFAQQYFGIIKLDEQNYFMTEVPIHFSISTFLWINVGTFLICLLMMILPSYVIAKISPVKAIRFN